MTYEEIVRQFIPCVNDVEEELRSFKQLDNTIMYLNGNGLLGYTNHIDYYFIWFTYIDNKVSNAKIVYNTVLELSKKAPVLYSGVKNFYANNSIEIDKNLYKIIIGG